jgi:hypothetical protein
VADPTIAALGAGLWQDTGTTVTSASVSPVSGSVVLAVAVITENGTLSGFDISNSLTLTQTDLGGGVLDTAGGFRTQCRIKSIPITSGAAMTVTAAATGGSHVQLFLFQITNQGVTPFGVSVATQLGSLTTAQRASRYRARRRSMAWCSADFQHAEQRRHVGDSGL